MFAADRQPDSFDQPAAAADFRVEPEVVAGATVILRVTGEIDMLTAPILVDHVERHFVAESGAEPNPADTDSADAEPADGRSLVFDLTDVGFLGSAGLAVLADAYQTAVARRVGVWVVAPSHTVANPLRITGLDALLHVVPDLATALASIG